MDLRPRFTCSNCGKESFADPAEFRNFFTQKHGIVDRKPHVKVLCKSCVSTAEKKRKLTKRKKPKANLEKRYLHYL